MLSSQESVISSFLFHTKLPGHYNHCIASSWLQSMINYFTIFGERPLLLLFFQVERCYRNVSVKHNFAFLLRIVSVILIILTQYHHQYQDFHLSVNIIIVHFVKLVKWLTNLILKILYLLRIMVSTIWFSVTLKVNELFITIYLFIINYLSK